MRDRWCYRDDGLFLWKLCRQRSETLSAQPLDEFTFCMVVVGVSINYSNYTMRVCVCVCVRERERECVCVCVRVCVCLLDKTCFEKDSCFRHKMGHLVTV